MQRRNFLQLSTLAGTGLVAGLSSCASKETELDKLMGLASMSKEAQPISKEEREGRIAKAQALLLENKMGALILDCGTSMNYFTGVRWWPSERTLLAIIPAKGAVTYVCPAFEKDRLQEQVTIGKDIYVWEEDESPFALV